MLDFMRANTEVDFWVAPFAPDYHPDERGAAMDGRMLSPVAYDGRKLGKWFEKLRPPLPEFNAPGGMMIDLPDLPHVLDPPSSINTAVHAPKINRKTVVEGK